MELRHLRYFSVVAETGNLSRAAEKLFIAQPPLSTQIRQLEEELGVALFLRHPKGMRLTPAGEALVPEARFLLDRASRIADVVREAGDVDAGALAVGYVPSASSTVLPALMRVLRRKQPRLRLELREMISGDQAEALVAGYIDAGIARAPGPHPRLIVAHSVADPFCLALPSAIARRGARTLDLAEFAESSFVSFTRFRGPAYFDRSIYLCTQAGFSPRIRYEATTVHGVLDLVGAGLGVALVPASSSLLGVRGVSFRALRREVTPSGPQRAMEGPGESLALVRRKVDENPMLPLLDEAIRTIFGSIARRTASLTRARNRGSPSEPA